ncbi:MarP family serine protease [Leifsonia kafniensis]|uniref:MarP family serine protease n=1 Tax=Leifsonia kafniensis TaxID=475957 RepID=A0ABP7KJY6_9MICO
MIYGFLIIDILLFLVLVAAFFNGYSNGLLRSISGIVGLVLGAFAAYLVVPLVGSWVPAPEWRAAATLAAVIVLVFGGLSLGLSVGRRIGRRARKSVLGWLDRLLGAAFTLVATALAMSMLAFSLGTLGIPGVSTTIASSGVIRTINSVTPDPIQSWLAQLRSVAVAEGLPLITDVFDGPAPILPDQAIDNPDVATAVKSVVRITGNAFACGQNQSGSGFVAAPGRIVTNAHVVSGVTEPVVESPDGEVLQGTIVYFDAAVDLAVIAVPGLNTPALNLGKNLAPGGIGVAAGYPFGGPFVADPATVIALGPLVLQETTSQSLSAREVYTLASDIQQGESGGPLLSDTGHVVGVVFAKSAQTPNVGYALGMREVSPVVDQAAGLSEPVSSGSCVRG